MNKINEVNFELRIIEYRRYENEVCYKKQNALMDKILKYEIKLSIENPQKATKKIWELLNNSNLIVSSFVATWALNSNIFIEVALNKKIEMSKIKEYKISSFNAEIFVKQFLTNVYGGWKRDERFPDLSKYEKEITDN